MESINTYQCYKGRLHFFTLFLFILTAGISSWAQEPVITVRFANPQYDCVAKTYCLQVEFQSDTPEKQLFGMNVRLWYDDKTLEFLSFKNYINGYGPVNPNPPQISTGIASSGKTLFGLEGAAESVNGGVELVNPSAVTYISTTDWTRLFDICFRVDDQQALLTGNFCPSIIWDLEENTADGGFIAGDGLVLTLVKSQFTQTEPCKENVIQFNWTYDGIAGYPFGNPVNKVCITVPCGILAVDDNTGTTPVNGSLGGIAISNVLLNDKLNGEQATTGNVSVSAVNDPDDGVTLNVSTGAVIVAPGTPAGTFTITYRICEKANPANCDEALITVVVTASGKSTDLSIVKSVSNASPSVGSNITFTLTVTNKGISDATGVLVTDVLPAGFTLISATPSGGTWAPPVWTIGNLNNGETRTLPLLVRVNSSGPYTNTASVSGTEIDPVSENNSDSESVNPVVVNLTDLVINKSVDNDKPFYGNTVTFTITATNNGPSNATGVRITDVLPTGFSLVSATVSAGSWSAPVWSIPTLNAGVTQKMTLAARVNSAGPHVNIASITGSETDPDLNNNSDTVTVSPAIFLQSDLSLSKTVNNPAPVAGSNVTFTIAAANNGPSNATAVKVRDILPAGYMLISATPTSGSWSDPDWTIGTLNAGDTQTLTLVVRVNPSGPYTNTATITGTESDPAPGNNSASATTIPTGTTLTAVNEYFEVCNVAAFTGNILTNENTGSGPLTVRTAPVTAPLHGSITVSADGNFSYKPGAGYTGPDKVVLEVCNAVLCAKDTVFFTVVAIPVAVAGEDISLCVGEAGRLEGNKIENASPKWLLLSGPNNPLITGSDSTVALVSGLIPGTYQFGYSLTRGGCSGIDTLNVTVHPSPGAFAGADGVICSGSSYRIPDDQATNYSSIQWSWSGPGTLTGLNALHPLLTTGKNDTGKVVITMKVFPAGGNSCPATTDTIVISIIQAPRLSCPHTGGFTTDVTPGTCHWVSPPGSLSTGLATGSCAVSLTWKVINPDNTTIRGSNDVSGYIFRTGMSSVTYILESTDGQKDSCTFTVSVTDNEKPTLLCSPSGEINLNPGECDREILLIAPEFRDNCTRLSGMTYTVLNPGNVVTGPFPATQLIYRFRIGKSQVEWTATDDKGEIITCEQSVTLIADQLVVFAGNDSEVCEGSVYPLMNAAAPPGAALHWSTSGNGTFSDPQALQPAYTPGTADVQSGQVVLTLVAATLCSQDTDRMILMVSRYPSVNAGPDFSACEGEQLILNGATARDATLQWSASGTGILTDQTTLSPKYLPASGEKGLIRFVIEGKGTGSCIAAVRTDTVWATVHPSLMVDAGDDKIVLTNARTKLVVKASGGSGSYLYHWEPVNSVVSINADSTETLPLAGDARFIVRVTDELTGCTGSDTVNITVTGDVNELLVFYNAISPNGDGLNDFWYIDGIEYFPENDVRIFNRWGDRIREFINYGQQEVLWDGTNKNGKRVPDGTYYYVMKIKGLKSYTGWIQVKSSL